MNEFESDWISWVRVRVEWECFWVNLREDNKVSESKMAVAESSMAELKMAAIIKLSHNEWVKFILCKMAQSNMAEFKMAAIIKLIENEWVWVRLSFNQSFVLNGRIQDEVEFESEFILCKYESESKMAEFKMAAIQDGCHHQVESEWMSESEFCFVQMVRIQDGEWSESEWKSFFLLPSNGGNQSWQVWVSLREKLRWLNPRWWNSSCQNSRWLPSSS